MNEEDNQTNDKTKTEWKAPAIEVIDINESTQLNAGNGADGGTTFTSAS